MKTKTRNCRSARILAPVAALALCVGGCVVTSIYPYYTEKDLVFDARLLGNWMEAGHTNTDEYAKIEQSGAKSYCITTFAAGQTGGSDAHLFRLKQQLFLDTCQTNNSVDYVPVHQIAKVTLGTEVTAANLNYDWLEKLLKENPREIRHMTLREKHDDERGRIVLTAETRDLQSFILRHLNDTNAWNEPSRWKHRD